MDVSRVYDYQKLRLIFIIAVIFTMICPQTSVDLRVFSQEKGEIEVLGNIYEFDEDQRYEFSEIAPNSEQQALGKLFISGNAVFASTKEKIPSYSVKEGTVTFSYTYDNSKFPIGNRAWSITEDKTDLVNKTQLPTNIAKGALILQTSKDGNLWINTEMQTDLFVGHPMGMESFYVTNEIQQTNGTYYRVIVAYQLGRKTGQKQLGFISLPWDEYEYKEYAEVYTFFIQNEASMSSGVEQTLKYKLGEVVNTGMDNGFSKAKEIVPTDPHYGWELGDFFISGYTHITTSQNGTPVFLKNVGDKVTLWFHLKEHIDKLNGNEALSIVEDENGYNQQFQTAKTNLGRGGLYVRYTDYENVTHAPTLYTNFLEANTSVNADTKVQVFEEGDYEVALDYELKNDKTKLFGQSVLPEFNNYRMFAKFSIRNGNSMVYLFDSKTHSELNNSSVTSNGFYLDLAKSRYLDINIRREVMNMASDGLIEDTRFNKPAKDGEQYTEEGIYTITVNNKYTGQTTIKKIYVGSEKVLMATVNTGLSVSEIKEQLDKGATISEDGVLVKLPATQSNTFNQQGEKKEKLDNSVMIGVGMLILLLLIVVGISVIRKRNQKRKTCIELGEKVDEEGTK
ncbi:hypothetical protein NHG35_04835 [Aerococcaceae bacterium NML180378]|nr:hypothetical protein [Aerococcaceae bacterium NML180378]